MKRFLFFLVVIALIFPVINATISKNDTIKKKEINELIVVGNATKMFSLPLVIVNRDNIEASSFVSPADVLMRQPGISIARDAVWASSLNIRGFSEQRLIILVDGERIQTASDHAAALSLVDMNELDKIEVFKGASSVLYGSGAMGGVVNFVSQLPSYTKSFQSKGVVGSEFNSVNSLLATSASANFSTSKWYIRLNGSYRTAENVKTPGGVMPNSQFNDASWSLKSAVKYSENQEVQVNYQHFEGWDIGLPGGRSFPATATARYIGVSRNLLSGEYIISKITPNLKKVSFKLYTQNITRDVELKPNAIITTLPGSFNATTGAKLISDWRFNDIHYLTIGSEGWQRKATTYRLKVQNTSDTTTTVTGEQPTPNAKMLDIGAFAHYSLKIVPRKFIVNAGLRLDYIQTDNDTAYSPLFQYFVNKGVRTDVQNLGRRVAFESSVHNDINYAAHIDIIYFISKKQKMAFSLSNSYRAASIEERFKLIELGGPKHVGNPNLKPEKGTFANLNYSLNTNRFRAKIDVYVNYLSNLIAEKSDSYTYINTSGVSVTENAFVNMNINKALFVGTELDASYYLSNQILLTANASYTRTRDVDLNTPLPQIPPLKGFASIAYQTKGLIGSTLSVLWAAKQNEIAAGEIATNGYSVFNFDVNTKSIYLKKSFLRLFAGVNNILNTAYIEHLSTTRGLLKFEPGRNVYLKVKLGW